MKFIKRWQLMRSTREENIMEHSHQVAVLTHALAVIENKVYGGNVNVERAVLYALYHEVSEVMTGDMPTPVKYFNRQLHGEYAKVEQLAVDRIAATLPEPMQEELYPYLQAEKDCEEYVFVKAADKLSAYLNAWRSFARAIVNLFRRSGPLKRRCTKSACVRWNTSSSTSCRRLS